MKLRYLLVACVFLALSLRPLAQDEVPPSREEVLHLFSLMNVQQQVATVMESIAKQQRAIILDNLKRQNPHVSAKDLIHLDKFTADVMNDLPVQSMIEDMVPVYQKHLNKSDVAGLSAFYSSPAGQKLVREMPAMTIESMQAASPRLQVFMDKVMERAQAMANERQGKTSAAPENK